MAKCRPIIFSAEEVRAVLAGRKTMFRRVVKPQPTWHNTSHPIVQGDGVFFGIISNDFPQQDWRCPFGAPGDRLWVQETWATEPQFEHLRPSQIPASAQHSSRCVFGRHLVYNWHRFRPPVHMPRWASRLTLEVTEVRVERVQEISIEDIRAEGLVFPGPSVSYAGFEPTVLDPPYDNPWEMYQESWDSINAKRGHSWDANPWVWAGTFKTVTP